MFSKEKWTCRSPEEKMRCSKGSRGEEQEIPKGQAQGEIACSGILDKYEDLLVIKA